MKKCHTDNPLVKDVCRRVNKVAKKGGDYTNALFVELNTQRFTEEDVWAIADTFGGFTNDEVISAIINAKVVSAASVFLLLSVSGFKTRHCIIAFKQYNDEFLKNRLMIETFGFFHETYLRLQSLRREEMRYHA